MAKHAVFASSDIRATKAGHILNFLTEQDCDNGTVWAKGDQVEGSVNREIYKAKQATIGDKVYVAGSVPILPRARTKAENAETNFYNEKGSVMRMYALEPEDRFEVSTSLAKAVSSAVEVGHYIIIDAAAAGKYEEKAADEPTAAFEAIIRDIKTYGYGEGADTRMLLEVVRNGFYGQQA